MAVPVVLTLSLGGALVAAVPANADPADLTVSSATVSGRVFTVTGNATTGDSIELLDSDGNFAVRRTTVENGMYSMSYTIPGTTSGPMNFTVQQVTQQLGEDGSQTVTADVPATFSVTSPASGDTVDSRTVTFTGTGTEGQPVNIVNADGNRIVQATPAADGTWSGTYTFPNSAAVKQTLTANELNVGPDGAARDFTITLPAAAPEFTITSPKNGDTVKSRTVTFTGTGFEGQPVNVLNAAGDRLIQAIPAADGSWSGTYTFADTDAVTQNLTANETNVGAAGASQAFSITLPAAAPAAPSFTVTSPKNGETVKSRTVQFTGTGTEGEPVNVLAEDGTRLFQTIPGADGTWSATYTFPDTVAVTQNLTANELNVGAAGAPIDFTITLPAVETAPVPTLATPVITSPKTGAKLTGSNVTFTGTGTPGSNILLAVVPTAQVKAAEAQAAKAQAKVTAPKATTPADPQDPIVVGADGTWKVTLALKANDYTAEAASFLLDAQGQPVLDANGDPVVAGPSNDVEFVLTAAVTTPAGTRTATPVATATDADGSLAFTGSNTAPIAGFAALLVALGGVFTFFARRRRGVSN